MTEKRPLAVPVMRIILGLILASGALELAFRTVLFPQWRDLSPVISVAHPVYGAFNAPNLDARLFDPPSFDVRVTTNSLGFRDREQGFAQDLAGIWLCGASNTFGTGLPDDQIFAAQLERHGYTVANLAAQGTQIVTQSRVIRHLAGQGFRPRAVICTLTVPGFIGPFEASIEDFSRPLPAAINSDPVKPTARRLLAETMADRLGKLARPLQAISGPELKAMAIKSSAIYGAIRYGAGQVPALHQLGLRYGIRQDADLHVSGNRDLYSRTPAAASVAELEGSVRFLAALRDWVQAELKVPFAVVLLPSHHRIHPDKFAKLLAHGRLDPASQDLYGPERMVKAALDRAGIPLLDMAPPLEAANAQPLTFANNAHLNARAHAIVADEMAGWLRGHFSLAPAP